MELIPFVPIDEVAEIAVDALVAADVLAAVVLDDVAVLPVDPLVADVALAAVALDDVAVLPVDPLVADVVLVPDVALVVVPLAAVAADVVDVVGAPVVVDVVAVALAPVVLDDVVLAVDVAAVLPVDPLVPDVPVGDPVVSLHMCWGHAVEKLCVGALTIRRCDISHIVTRWIFYYTDKCGKCGSTVA